MIKNLVYNLLYFIDILFLYVQYTLIKLFNKKKFNYVLFFGGWGQLVQSVFISHLLNKKDYKLILVLDYDKFNLRLEDFSPKHKIKKIYSLFKLINRDFSQYPSNIQKDIKKLCSSIFCDDFINLEKILYNEDQTFLNKNLLSNYFKRTIKNNIKISHSIISFNSSKFNTKINKFFYPKKEIKNLIQKKLKIKDNEIKKKSINITFRLRNKSFNNFDRTNYLRDSNFKNLKIIINYLLKNTDYTLFITGDCDQIDIKHKNLIYYQKVKKQISKNLYTLAIQTLSNYHILQASGANELIKFNKCKCLYIDCWPPMNFFSNSVILFKNIYENNNKRVDCISYLKKYLKSFLSKNKNNDLVQSKRNFIKFYKANNFKIINNDKKQILIALNEFLDFISNKKIVRMNYNLNNYYKKRLIENKSFLSKANFK